MKRTSSHTPTLQRRIAFKSSQRTERDIEPNDPKRFAPRRAKHARINRDVINTWQPEQLQKGRGKEKEGRRRIFKSNGDHGPSGATDDGDRGFKQLVGLFDGNLVGVSTTAGTNGIKCSPNGNVVMIMLDIRVRRRRNMNSPN
jgi:hypothetical protein